MQREEFRLREPRWGKLLREMKPDPGQQAVPAAFTGFVVAEEHASPLDRLRAEVSASTLVADALQHTKAAWAAGMAWLRTGVARLTKPREHETSGASSIITVSTLRQRAQDVLDLCAGIGQFGVLFLLIVFRGGAAPRKSRGRKTSQKQRYFAFHTGLFVTLAALGAAVLIPERDNSAFFGAIVPSNAELVTEHLRNAIPETAEKAPPRASIALPFTPEAEMPWVQVRRPLPMYSLEGPEVEGSELDYRVFTRGPSARQDTMTFAPKRANTITKPHVHLVIERFEASRPTQRPLFADLAARAAERHASLERMSPPSELPSKFGPFQIAEAVIGQEGSPLGCLAFRRVDMAGVIIAGWYCAPAKRPVNRVELTCFLNRLDLVGAGNDTRLKQIFAEAERQRGACASSRQAGRKTTWLDHEAPVPPLKLNSKPR